MVPVPIFPGKTSHPFIIDWVYSQVKVITILSRFYSGAYQAPSNALGAALLKQGAPARIRKLMQAGALLHIEALPQMTSLTRYKWEYRDRSLYSHAELC